MSCIISLRIQPSYLDPRYVVYVLTIKLSYLDPSDSNIYFILFWHYLHYLFLVNLLYGCDFIITCSL